MAPHPRWIRPDEKLATADVMALMRDHFEGTPYDMGAGLNAGLYGTLTRWRPTSWEMGGATSSRKRPIRGQQRGFSFVAQSRARLPGPIGGADGYGVDDTSMTVDVPRRAGIEGCRRARPPGRCRCSPGSRRGGCST